MQQTIKLPEGWTPREPTFIENAHEFLWFAQDCLLLILIFVAIRAVTRLTIWLEVTGKAVHKHDNPEVEVPLED